MRGGEIEGHSPASAPPQAALDDVANGIVLDDNGRAPALEEGRVGRSIASADAVVGELTVFRSLEDVEMAFLANVQAARRSIAESEAGYRARAFLAVGLETALNVVEGHSMPSRRLNNAAHPFDAFSSTEVDVVDEMAAELETSGSCTVVETPVDPPPPSVERVAAAASNAARDTGTEVRVEVAGVVATATPPPRDATEEPHDSEEPTAAPALTSVSRSESDRSAPALTAAPSTADSALSTIAVPSSSHSPPAADPLITPAPDAAPLITPASGSATASLATCDPSSREASLVAPPLLMPAACTALSLPRASPAPELPVGYYGASALAVRAACGSMARRIMTHSPKAIGTFRDIGKGVTAALRSYIVASALAAWTAFSSLARRIMRHSPEAIGTFWDIGKGVTVASAVTAWTAYSSLTHRITTHSPEAIGTFWDIGKGVAAALRSYVVAAAFTAVATFAASSSLADHIKNAGHAGDTERRLRDALPLTLPKPSAAPALGASSRQRGRFADAFALRVRRVEPIRDPDEKWTWP